MLFLHHHTTTTTTAPSQAYNSLLCLHCSAFTFKAISSTTRIKASLIDNTFQSARQSRYRHQEDSTPQIFSVSFVHQTPFLLSVFHSSSLYLFFFSKSSVMGRVCFDKMQSSRPRADFLLGWIQLNQPVPDHPSVSIRDRQQSF